VDYTTSLQIDANPAIYLPGKPVRTHWKVRGYTLIQPGAEVQLRIFAPSGVLPEDGSLASQVSPDGYLTLPVDQAQAEITWNVSPEAQVPFYFGMQLLVNGEKIDENAILMDVAHYEVDSAQGGSLDDLSGKVHLEMPEGAGSETLAMDVRNPSPNKFSPVSLTGNPIEIIAAGETSGENVTHFNRPVTLTVSYDPAQIFDWSETDLQLFYYNQDVHDWYPLETTVDTETHTMTAMTDHLTVYDYKAASWQAYTLPSVDAFKVNDFTGAGTYAMDFWSPPGPGGLKPSLSLTYNSQVIDESSSYTQASWVGMGWSLDTGAIIRNMHETNDNLNDDTFSVSGGGTSGLLLPVSVTDPITTYNTANQSFTKVTYNSSSDVWTVYGKDGTIYTYDLQAKTNKSSGCSGTLDLTWRWSLHTVTNIRGKTITYNYFTETKPSCSNQIAVYPVTIYYPNNVYRILFSLEGRNDYQQSWTTSPYKVLYGIYRLKEIFIQYDSSGTWSNPTTIRKYAFTYADTTTTNVIYPNFHWSANDATGRTLTLVSVQEYSGDNSLSLPATSFYYEDNLHLTKVQNGQGGEVAMTYDEWHYFDDINKIRNLTENYGDVDGYICHTYFLTWSKIYVPGVYPGPVRCERGLDTMQIGQRAQGDEDGAGKGRHSIPEDFVKLGGWYRFYILASSIMVNYPAQVQLGLANTSTGDELWSPTPNPTVCNSTTPPCNAYQGVEFSFFLPVDWNPTASYMQIACDDCRISQVQFITQPTYYRVKTRTVTDLTVTPNQSTTYNYEYENPSTNSKDTSAAVATAGANYGQLYTYPLRENRGHAMTMQFGPDDMSTINWYYQSDALKGTSYRSLVVKKDFYDNLDNSVSGDASWTSFTGTGGSITSPALLYQVDYDPSVKATGGSGANDWSGLTRASINGLSEGKVAITTIRLCGSIVDNCTNPNLEAEVGLMTQSNKLFYLSFQMSGGQPAVSLKYNLGSGLNTGVLTGAGSLSLYKWYVVMLQIDYDDGFQVKLWQLDHPEIYYEGSVNGFPSSETWSFRERVRNGSLYMDAYLEGVPYSVSATTYTVDTQYDTDTTNGIPNLAISSLLTYKDLSVVWSRPTMTVSKTYASDAAANIGDAKWIGRKTNYSYDAAPQNNKQYGNLTGVTESSGSSSSSWIAYRQTNNWYWPNDSGPYLVNFPAATNQYYCPGAYSYCSNASSTRLSAIQYIYDSNTAYNQQPSSGVLAAKRVQLTMDANGQNVTFQDEQYYYDSWANVQYVVRYTQPGTANSIFVGGGQISQTNYDSLAHTYVSEQYEPLNPIPTRLYYDYTIAAPVLEIDPNGNLTTADYDKFGRPLDIIRPGDSLASPSFHVIYHDVGGSNPRFWTEAQQRVDSSYILQVRKFYNGLGQLVQTQTAHAYIYVGSSSIYQDVVVDYRYDNLGRLVQQSVPYNVTPGSDFHSPDSGQPFTQTDYDYLSRTKIVTKPDQTTQQTAYAMSISSSDATFITAVTDPNGNVTTTSTDAWGRTAKVAPPIGPQTGYYYDQLNRLTDVKRLDATPYTLSHMAYDSAGRKTSMTDADMGYWVYTYDALGNLKSQTDANSKLTCLYYDSINRMVQKQYRSDSTCPASISSADVTNTYDGISNTNSFPGTTWPSGWSRSSATNVTKPADGIVRITGKSDWTVYAYRSVAISNSPAAVRFAFKINNAGSVGLAELTSGVGAPYAMGVYVGTCGGQYGLCYLTRDPINGQSIVYLMPLTVGATYEVVITADPYTNFRIQIWDKDNPQGANAQYTVAHPNWTGMAWTFYDYMYYGSQDLLSSGTQSVRPPYIEFQANGIDQRVKMLDGSGSTVWSYDSRGRLANEQKTIGSSGTFATSWGYNSADQVATMTYPGGNTNQAGEVVTYSYTSQMTLQSMLGSSTYLFSTDYDAAGRVVARKLGTPWANNIKTTYTYYGWNSIGEGGRLDTLTSVNTYNGTTYQNFHYTFDNDGNITQIDDALAGPQTQSFSYDELNRLKTAQANAGNGGGYGTENYYYDDTTGNLSKNTPTNYHYGISGSVCLAQNLLPHAVTSVDNPSSSYTYDCNGNMITRTIGSRVYTLAYDRENHLTSISWIAAGVPPSNYLLSFVYDGDGNRVQTVLLINGNITLSTVFIGSYFEWSANTMTKYYYAGSARIAMRVGTASPIYILGDHLGSTSKTIDSSNWSTITELRYKAWGETRYPTGTISTPTSYRFTGQQQQPSDIGIYLYGSRFYDPSLGRFLSPDTIVPDPYNPESYDRYSYCLNNPIIFIDPSGHTNRPPDMNMDKCGPDGRGCGGIKDPNPTVISKGGAVIVLPDIVISGDLTYEGGMLYKVYLDMCRNQGWWNVDGTLTLEQFFGFLIIAEGNNNNQYISYVLRVAIQQVYYGSSNPPYCPVGKSGVLANAYILNFFAKWSEVAQKWAINGFQSCGKLPLNSAKSDNTIAVLANAGAQGYSLTHHNYVPIGNPKDVISDGGSDYALGDWNFTDVDQATETNGVFYVIYFDSDKNEDRYIVYYSVNAYNQYHK
jgi:RHS repeat-associated protein